VSASDAVDSVLKQHHISLSHTKIGSPYVIKQMEDDSRTGVSTGWEVNGGFMTSSDITYKNGTLTQLPTRDAFLPILIALTIAAEKHVALSEVFAALPPRYTQAGLLDNFPQEKSTAIIETLGKNNANSQALIAQVFTPENGFAAVQSVDTTDGIKIFFANQDIAHIRPSGNAPQLRIYATADNQDRADTIVNLSLADGGILRTLETLV
jgi:phosphomannomutase